MKRTSFWVLVLKGLIGLHRTVQFSLFSITGQAQTWITMILNGLPWKRKEIILSFLRLHPSTEFRTQGSVELAALIQKSCKDTALLLTVVKNTHIKSN